MVCCGLAMVVACGGPAPPAPGEPGSTCEDNEQDRCHRVDGESRPMSCRHGVWALHPACEVGTTCLVDDKLGAVCSDATKGVPIPCSDSAKDCDDGNHCTADTCSTVGCSHHALGQLTACDDGDLCTSGSRCGTGGVCSGGKTLTCADYDPCTTDSCTPAKGCLHSKIDGCVACKVPTGESPKSQARTYLWNAIRHDFSSAGCDVNEDGKPDTGLQIVGQALVAFGGSALQQHGWQLLQHMGDVWRYVPTEKPGVAEKGGKIELLLSVAPACSVDPATACTVVVNPLTYDQVLDAHTCPVRHQLDATAAEAASPTQQLQLESTGKQATALQMPLGWLCEGNSFVAARTWAVPLRLASIRLSETTEGAHKGSATLRICGAVRMTDLLSAHAKGSAHCATLGLAAGPAWLGNRSPASLLKADTDTDGDGKADAIALTYQITGRRVDWTGGAWW